MRRREIHELDFLRQTGRAAAQVLERCLACAANGYSFSSAMEVVRDDGLL